eukprot:Selendium_serpulae@DN6275_c4_g1_i21.p1
MATFAKRTHDEISTDHLAKKTHLSYGVQKPEAPESPPSQDGQFIPQDRPKRTPVIVFHGISPMTTEDDIQSMVAPFNGGLPAKVFVRPTGGQSFVEFSNDTAAASALQYFSQTPAIIKGCTLSVTASKRGCVTLSERPQEMCKIVLVSITSITWTVDMETLHGLLSRFGYVEKIVCFGKTPALFQALVEFRHPSEAKSALANLHNRNMYEELV